MPRLSDAPAVYLRIESNTGAGNGQTETDGRHGVCFLPDNAWNAHSDAEQAWHGNAILAPRARATQAPLRGREPARCHIHTERTGSAARVCGETGCAASRAVRATRGGNACPGSDRLRGRRELRRRRAARRRTPRGGGGAHGCGGWRRRRTLHSGECALYACARATREGTTCAQAGSHPAHLTSRPCAISAAAPARLPGVKYRGARARARVADGRGTPVR